MFKLIGSQSEPEFQATFKLRHSVKVIGVIFRMQSISNFENKL